MKNLQDVHLFSYNARNYSRSGTFLTNIEKRLDWRYHQVPKGILQSISFVKKIRKDIGINSKLVVLSGSSLIVLYLRILRFHKRQVVLDLGWTSYEANMSRNFGKTRFWHLIRAYFLDFLSLHLSNVVFVETFAQKEFLIKVFFLTKRKLIVVPTGVNEVEFKEAKMDPGEFAHLGSNFFLFRGKNVPESGLRNLATASWKLPDGIRLLIITNSIGEEKFNPSNTTVLEGHQQLSLIKYAYKNAYAVIGQVSDSKRLKRTVPHKAFEAAFFEKAYITPASDGMIEMFGRECLCIIDSPQADSISRYLVFLSERPLLVSEKGKVFNHIYQENYSQKMLQSIFIQEIQLSN